MKVEGREKDQKRHDKYKLKVKLGVLEGPDRNRKRRPKTENNGDLWFQPYVLSGTAGIKKYSKFILEFCMLSPVWFLYT